MSHKINNDDSYERKPGDGAEKSQENEVYKLEEDDKDLNDQLTKHVPIQNPPDPNKSKEIQTPPDPNKSKEIQTPPDPNKSKEIQILPDPNKSKEIQLSSESKDPDSQLASSTSTQYWKQLITNGSKWLPTNRDVAIIIAFILIIAICIVLANVWANRIRIELTEECMREKEKINEKREKCHIRKTASQKCFETKKKTLHHTIELITHSKKEMEQEYSQCKEENVNMKKEHTDKIIELEGQLSQIREEYKRLQKDHEALKIKEKNCSDNLTKCDVDAKTKENEWEEKEDDYKTEVLKGDSKLERCNEHIEELNDTLNDCQKEVQEFQSSNKEPSPIYTWAIRIAAVFFIAFCCCIVFLFFVVLSIIYKKRKYSNLTNRVLN